jgi:intracellular multiplication protein IcmJ
MSLLPLSLGVKRNIDAQGGGSSKRKPLSRQQISKLLQHTLEKDGYACCYCGFTARQFQKAIPKDWSANDPRDAELVTACIFCEQCLALDTVGAMSSGALLWLPDISQVALNHIARSIYAVKAYGDKASATMKQCADRALEVLMNCKGEAKRRIGTDDPIVLAAVFMENLEDKTYRKRNEKLEGVKLLPLDRRVIASLNGEVDQFPKIVAHWISEEGPYGKMPPEKWESLASFADKAGKAVSG